MEALGINLNLFLAQLINFGAVVWLLWVVLYKPVTNLLNERTRRIEESLKEADRVQQQTVSARAEYEQEMAKARKEAAQMLAQAQERAKAQEAEILTQARNEAERLKAEARDQARIEREQMLRDVKAQVADLVILAASKVLQTEIAKKGHEKEIEESLAALGRQN